MRQIIEDKDGIIRAEIEIKSIEGNLFMGKITRNSFSEYQKQIFKEYEDLVNNQVFALLDDLENKIASFGFKLKGEDFKIFDLQIWEMKKFSFRKK